MTTVNEPTKTLKPKYSPHQLRNIVIAYRMEKYDEYPDTLVARYIVDRHIGADHDYAWSSEHGWLRREIDESGESEDGEHEDEDADEDDSMVWMKADESKIVNLVTESLLWEYCNSTSDSEREKWIPAQSAERVFGIVKLVRNHLHVPGIAPGEKAPGWRETFDLTETTPWLDKESNWTWPQTNDEATAIIGRMTRLRRLG